MIVIRYFHGLWHREPSFSYLGIKFGDILGWGNITKG